MRLDKYLADAGTGSRQAVKKIIRSGVVTVGSETIRDPGFLVSDEALVCVEGQPISYQKHYYFMLNKPAGYLTANKDDRCPTVLDLFPEHLREKIFAVGRLDKDTVGLLLLTNDGGLSHRLTSPKWKAPKTYLLKTDLPMTAEDASAAASGICLRDGTTYAPARLEIDPEDPLCGTITLTEGKYHEIKRMLKSMGKTVTCLKRVSMGGLSLDPDLAEGTYRPLTEEEVRNLKQK